MVSRARTDAAHLDIQFNESNSEHVEGHQREDLPWEWIDPDRAEEARRWFFRWRDGDFSFTDCSSFVIMLELGLGDALTSDRHFERAGYRMVPRTAGSLSRPPRSTMTSWTSRTSPATG